MLTVSLMMKMSARRLLLVSAKLDTGISFAIIKRRRRNLLFTQMPNGRITKKTGIYPRVLKLSRGARQTVNKGLRLRLTHIVMDVYHLRRQQLKW